VPTLADLRVGPPRSWEEFEYIVCSAAKNRWDSPDFTCHGRKGQRQDGVDVYGSDNKGRLVGIQCKNTWDGITLKTIEAEISKAESFRPQLKALYLATTAETDKNVQSLIRDISAKREKRGAFGVMILFWTDIWSDLTLNENRLFQHYPNLRPTDSSGKKEPSHDQILFQKFQSVLSFVPAIELLRDHDFRNAFPRRSIEPLCEFVDNWNDPEKEFIDSKLQEKFMALKKSANSLSEHFAEKTVMVGKGDNLSVFGDHHRSAGERPDWVKEQSKVLNKEAYEFYLIYKDFLRLCKRELCA
jgi:hypothetical protein